MPRTKEFHEWDKDSFHIYFHKAQGDYLRKLAHRRGVSISVIVREIVDRHRQAAAA